MNGKSYILIICLAFVLAGCGGKVDITLESDVEPVSGVKVNIYLLEEYSGIVGEVYDHSVTTDGNGQATTYSVAGKMIRIIPAKGPNSADVLVGHIWDESVNINIDPQGELNLDI